MKELMPRTVWDLQREQKTPAQIGREFFVGGVCEAIRYSARIEYRDHRGNHKGCPYVIGQPFVTVPIQTLGRRMRLVPHAAMRAHAGWRYHRGALRGVSPRTREGRRPDRTTAVVGGQ